MGKILKSRGVFQLDAAETRTVARVDGARSRRVAFTRGAPSFFLNRRRGGPISRRTDPGGTQTFFATMNTRTAMTVLRRQRSDQRRVRPAGAAAAP